MPRPSACRTASFGTLQGISGETMISAESSGLTVQVPNGRRSRWLTAGSQTSVGVRANIRKLIFMNRGATRRKRSIVRRNGGRGRTERSFTFATKEARFHSMNLGIRGPGLALFEGVRVYSSLFAARTEGGVDSTTRSGPMKVNHSAKPRKGVFKVSRSAPGLT